MSNKKHMIKKEKIHLRVVKGGLQPVDKYAESRLRDKNYRVGDIVGANITKLRNPGFHRLVHGIGELCAHQIERFKGLNGHEVIKEIQLEAGIKCITEEFNVPGLGKITRTTAESIAFDNMDEAEFQELALNLCRHVSATYWPDLSPEQIQMQAERFIYE